MRPRFCVLTCSLALRDVNDANLFAHRSRLRLRRSARRDAFCHFLCSLLLI